MAIRALFLSASALVALAGSASAQSIAVEGLEAAKAFTPGIEVARGLNAEAWAGTSADRATRLLQEIPAETSHPIVRDMLRRVVLAGLVSPSGSDPAFERARIQAAQILATPDEYARFTARNPVAQDPALRVDAYIARGNLDAACEISDAITQGRGESGWVRLRAACHMARGEIAAADLAQELLRSRGEEPVLVVPDPPEGFWIEAMELDAAALDRFMTDLASDLDMPAPPASLVGPSPFEISSDTISQTDPAGGTSADIPEDVLDDIEVGVPFSTDTIVSGEVTDVDTDNGAEAGSELTALLTDMSPEATAKLYLLGRDGDARAVSEFVARAEANGLDTARVLSRIPAILDPADMAVANLPLFARYAVVTRDIAMMQALFDATTDELTRERLALASDAMGNGFIGRPLGAGLELALAETAPNASRDVLMALALGADLTEPVEAMLAEAVLPGTVDADWIGIDHAIDRGARAESLLRLAEQVASDDIAINQVANDQIANDKVADSWTIYRTIRRLRDAGFSDTAGQLAAYEYLRGL